jgi:hypothetical protein
MLEALVVAKIHQAERLANTLRQESPRDRVSRREDTADQNNARVIDWFQHHYHELHGEMSSEQQQWEEEMTDFSHEY